MVLRWIIAIYGAMLEAQVSLSEVLLKLSAPGKSFEALTEIDSTI